MSRSIDSPYTELDRTVRVYDSFYNFNLVVNASEYDLVHSYFMSVCETRNIADNFTTFFFRISNITGIPTQTLLEQVQGTGSKIELTGLMAYYLNSLKSKTTLYGISVIPQPNNSVQRNVVQ